MTQTATKPVYALVGSDTLLRDEHRNRIVSMIVGDADPQLCISQFDSDAEASAVFDELRTMPFLAPHRIVIIRDAEAFIAAHRDSLEKYLAAPSSSGTLVLIMNSLDKRTNFAKSLPKVGEVISCESPTGADLSNWVINEFNGRGKQISPQTATELCQMVPEGLADLKNEVEKLIAYTGERPEITSADLSAIISARHAPEAFAMSNAITSGNVPKALQTLSSAMTIRGAEFMLLGQMGWHLRRALQAAQRIAAGENPQAVMKSLRIFYGQREFQAMIQRRGAAKLQADVRRLMAADIAMKSGSSPKAAMQQLVIELCS